MNNPIEIGNKLKKSYLQYIREGIPLVEEYYEKEREKLYEEDGAIMHPPYIEIVKKYKGKKNLSEICRENQIDMRISDFINRGLLLTEDGEERCLYEHQERAIIDVLKRKKNMVITTGTGSGKTEGFLIPLLANIIQESFLWKKDKKRPALRTIIFYPLNALAEDQMVRLRKSLARDEITKWYEDNKINDQITFGRYIGRTPRDKTDTRYTEIKDRWELIQRNIDNSKNENDKSNLQNLIYTGPCCTEGSSEIVHRKKMQETPPDILITNYSMLNIMLMRKAEQSIFEKTREWLESDERNVFTLIIDELHTYRGTAGTEIAYIIKVLLNRLGLSPSSPQVRFLASSASMSNSDESRKYISDFFGTDNSQFDSIFSLITDKPQLESEVSKNSLPSLPLEKLQEIVDAAKGGTFEEAINEIFKNRQAITDFVKTNKLVEWLKYSMYNPKTGQISAKSINKIKDDFFEVCDAEHKQMFLEIFLLLINIAEDDDKLALQPLRAHYFLRNIENLYLCINADCDAVDPMFRSEETRQYGKMYNQPLTRCSCGSYIYEAIVCRHCGEMFFCGYIDSEHKVNNVPDVYTPQKPAVFYIPDMSLYSDKEIDALKKNWSRINFDIKNREFKPDRHGKYFHCKDNPHEEWPSTCPRCEFTTKNWATDNFYALFRHGTGVQKVNQVCADTLMHLLTESNEKRKLVVFSDSRQSAAKLSAGIEIDHYRDALRQAILSSFESNIGLLECLRLFREEQSYKIPEESLNDIKEDNYLSNILAEISMERLGVSSQTKKEKLDEKLSATNPTLKYIIDTIIKNLINAGLNPAGPYPNISYSDPNNRYKRWYEYIKDDRTGFKNETNEEEAFYKKIEQFCKAEILKIMLGSPKRSFESLGLGYYHVQKTIEGEEEFLNSLVRIIGESNRIVDKAEEQKSRPQRLWKYLKAVKNETMQNYPIMKKIDRHFYETETIKADDDKRLTGGNLVFIPAKSGDNVWECRRCGTKHLHGSCGICTYCFSDLPKPRKLTEDELNDTYYTHKRKIDKLHCEELTGQTNTKDALDRQRLFQDIFCDKENENIDGIELLSVTTTMEAGVDIGSLLAIMLGNVPPQRFNYQQRVGRAGRRGSPLSIALTVAKANSHDQMHYANPDRIVAGEPVPPYLDFSSEDIFRRIVYKEILKKAFEDCCISIDDNENSLVHGQFGKVADWEKNKLRIKNWLDAQEDIVLDFSYLIGDFETEDEKGKKKNILKNINAELIGSIDETIRNQNFNQIHLSERLAAGGRLPMFGFPTQVRYLYEEKPRKLPADKVTDRPMDLALATFAPGSEIVKDKKVYLAAGFVDFEIKEGRTTPVDGLVRYDNQILYQCSECWYTAVNNKDEISIASCPVCGSTRVAICSDICSPKGYCVDFNKQAKDFDGNFSWQPVKVNSKLDSKVTREIGLNQIADTNLRYGNNGKFDKGIVRTINTNNGELFKVHETKDNGWLISSPEKNSKSIKREREIALVSTKVTGIILLAVNSENHFVCINPLYKGKLENPNVARSQVIKSAFLSWGELIRRSVTSFLDIRSDELSVDYSVRRDNEDAIPYPSIYMIEQLENGAGYTNYLAMLPPTQKQRVFIGSLITGGEIFELLTRKHQNHCDTSCYDCLCDYNNQQQHGLLNWRLGLDVASLSQSNEFIPTYAKEDSYWHSILTKTEGIINKHGSGNELIKEADYWYIQSKDGIKFIYHPLWSEKYILENSNKIGCPTERVKYISLLDFINNPPLD